MKKSALIAALLCAVSSGVYAASDVTLYGVVDGAVSVSKAKGKAARVGFDNGIWAGSRFGIKGNEDLGSGYNLGFILEQGFKTFSGDAMNSSKAFARQSPLLSVPLQPAYRRFVFRLRNLQYSARFLSLDFLLQHRQYLRHVHSFRPYGQCPAVQHTGHERLHHSLHVLQRHG